MAIEPEAMEYIVSTWLLNSRSSEIKIYLEPWGEEYSMPLGARFEVRVKGPRGGSLEVEFADDHITVYGWSGSVVTLLHEGAELGAGLWERTPVPPVPPYEEK